MPSSGFKTCALDRKSTRLNSSHTIISYAVFCLKKKMHALGFKWWGLKQGGSCAVITVRRAVRHTLKSFDQRADDVAQPAHAARVFSFFNDPEPPEISPLPLHAVLPI